MSEDRPLFAQGHLVAQRFEVVAHIGAGGFGDIYSAVDRENRQICAMKVEYLNAHKKALDDEIKIMKKINGSQFFPELIAHGIDHDIIYLVMQLHGPSLATMRRAMNKGRFGLYTTMRLSLEMIRCIEEFHRFHFVHHDIKPGNFLIRADRRHPLVLIDFGLSESYVNYGSHEHVMKRCNAGFTGTYKYSSIHAHKDMTLSRRDDLISWFYSVLELVNGSLPWPGKSDKKKTFEMKKYANIAQLCDLLPSEYKKIYRYVSNLRFRETPDYDWIKNQIINAIESYQYGEMTYDWETLSLEEICRISQVKLTISDAHETIYDMRVDDDLINEDGCTACSVQ